MSLARSVGTDEYVDAGNKVELGLMKGCKVLQNKLSNAVFMFTNYYFHIAIIFC